MDLGNPLDILKSANQMRQTQNWGEAVRLYGQLEVQLRDDGVFHHNFALSLLGAKQTGLALVQAERALALLPHLWQAAVVKVRALSAEGRAQEAADVLEDLTLRYPERGEFALELASITLHHICNARLARQLVQPHLHKPATATDACLTDIVASLYDRDETAQSLNTRALAFARSHLDRSDSKPVMPLVPLASRKGRKRLGLLSPHLNCSPVFFFCSGALRLLCQDFDLVFLSRSPVADWATAELRLLASDWFDVVSLNAEQLDAFVRSQSLDVLLDLGGWMDPVALKAISTKPAALMYKWVGGQSISTGLRAFDGFITDLEQTPLGFEGWFTEPLVRLPKGYVSYSPPSYLPAPVAASTHSHVLGVIANPVKVSQPFLEQLCANLQHRRVEGTPIALRLIDKRYGNRALQARILASLQAAQLQLGDQLRVEFVTPTSHLAYLTAVGQLSEVADTFPYTGGLTTMEALSLGVPCSGQLGALFCERHTHAHRSFLQSSSIASEARSPLPGELRQSLVPPNSPRSDHAALAASLAQLFTTGGVEEVAT